MLSAPWDLHTLPFSQIAPLTPIRSSSGSQFEHPCSDKPSLTLQDWAQQPVSLQVPFIRIASFTHRHLHLDSKPL